MSKLPSGTVAFLMSDIEGSTRLIAAAGDGFPALLDEHFGLIRAAIEEYGGTIVSTEGDSVFAVLPTGRAALSAAVAAQRGLETHTWPAGLAVHVRMGIHVGEAVLGGRDYTGIDVHRTARIMAAGWGGEILASQALEALVGRAPEDAVTLRDLGVHSLRDIADAENLYQVVASGLRADFPPPRTESAAARTNLPTPLTRFVGRARELTEVERLLDDARLVTLTGPGGTGKTRIAIEVGRAALVRFPDGVFFVALDAFRDPDLVLPQIAQTLGLAEDPARPLAEVLAGYLSGKKLLIVLDNLEQVISAAPRISALLGAASTFVILASSREPLGIAGETVYPVPPLTLPSEPGHPTAEQVAAQEAVQLFVERARAARSGFALTDENASAVAAICRRVDGLPLAIELAAARINVLAPAQILERLDHRLTLLSGSRRDVSDRQRTLRGAIDWSYELLSDDEKAGFRRFSVFAGGANLDAVLAVIDPDSTLAVDPLDLVAALVERSLVGTGDERTGARFAMLETIREYAAEKLEGSGEATTVRDRHADHFAAIADEARDVLFAPNRDERLDGLDAEMPNMRTALEWSVGCGNVGRATTMAVGLKEFWRTRSHLAEARRLIERILDAWPADGDKKQLADVLGVGGELASWNTDYQRAREMTELQITLREEIGDQPGLAIAYSGLGWSHLYAEPATARDAFQKSADIAREAGDEALELAAIQGLGLALIRTGDMDGARDIAQMAVDKGYQDDYTIAFNIMTLATVELRRGNFSGAAEWFSNALRRAVAAHADIGIAITIDGVGALIFESGGDMELAACLSLVSNRMRGEMGGAPSLELAGYEPTTERVRAVDPGAYERALLSAGDMTNERAAQAALEAATAIAAGVAQSG